MNTTGTSTAPAAHIVDVDGGGSCRCSDCAGRLDYSWRVTLSDNTRLSLCSTCLTGRS